MMEKPEPDSLTEPITPVQVCALCRTATASSKTYGSLSPNQVAFFTLVWAAKQGARVDLPNACLADEDGAFLTRAKVAAQIILIQENLLLSGPVVDELRDKDAKAWAVLRFQLTKTLGGYDCRLTDKEDALGNVAIKVWELLLRTPTVTWIDSYPDAMAAAAHAGALTKIFDFTTPFYAYALRMARNELITILRKKQAPHDYDSDSEREMAPEDPKRREPEYEPDWNRIIEQTDSAKQRRNDDILHSQSENDQAEQGVEQVHEERASLALRSTLIRLLHEIDNLPQRQRQVLHLTFLARPQFFYALDILELEMPPGIAAQLSLPPVTNSQQQAGMPDAATYLAALPDDRALAAQMDSTPNLVAVTRHHALQRISRIDLELGNLLQRLVGPYRARYDKTGDLPVNTGAEQA